SVGPSPTLATRCEILEYVGFLGMLHLACSLILANHQSSLVNNRTIYQSAHPPVTTWPWCGPSVPSCFVSTSFVPSCLRGCRTGLKPCATVVVLCSVVS